MIELEVGLQVGVVGAGEQIDAEGPFVPGRGGSEQTARACEDSLAAESLGERELLLDVRIDPQRAALDIHLVFELLAQAIDHEQPTAPASNGPGHRGEIKRLIIARNILGYGREELK